VLESLLVPYALLVKDENLLAFHITEHHVLVEEISGPHQLVFNGLCWHLLEILDIDNVLGNLSEQHGFVENYLLGVRQQL
jgi:hypothetical protein